MAKQSQMDKLIAKVDTEIARLMALEAAIDGYNSISDARQAVQLALQRVHAVKEFVGTGVGAGDTPGTPKRRRTRKRKHGLPANGAPVE